MTFLTPGMLWSLVVLIPLAALYFLQVRPRRQLSTAYFLWDAILRESRTTSLFQRLRDSLSLVMMVLAISAICLCLAQPEWDTPWRELFVVVDRSASMATRTTFGDRMSQAKSIARRFATELNGSQRMALASLGQDLDIHTHLTSSPRELLDAIDKLEAVPEGTSLHAWEQLGEFILKDRGDKRVRLISDRSIIPDAWRVAEGEWIPVGATANNGGIVAADMMFLPDGSGTLGVFLQLASSASTNQRRDLLLSYLPDDGAPVLMKATSVDLRPGLNPPLQMTVTDAPAGRWIAELDPPDSLEMDDRAYLIARQVPPTRVSVVGSDRFFLEHSIQAFSSSRGSMQLTDVDPEVVVARGASPYAPRTVIFQPTGESPWWSGVGDELLDVVPRVRAPEHPVIKHVGVEQIGFVGARQITPAAGAQVLVADEIGTPLIFLADHDRRAAMVVNMDPVASEFYFSMAFPTLVHAAVAHLAGRDEYLPSAVRPGDPIPWPAPQIDTNGTLRSIGFRGGSLTPPTRAIEQTVARSEPFPSHVGFFEFVAAGKTTPLAASLLDPQETLLGDPQRREPPPNRFGRSPVYWLTVIAILVLSGESILYHRRKVG